MAAEIGKCKLCLTENVALQRSHVLPRWSYGRLRDTRPGENPSPVHIEGGEARYNQTHVKECMLCFPCEQKFGDYDDEVSRLAYADGVFPALQKVGPEEGELDAIKFASVGSLDAQRLGYFACSIVWRAHCALRVPDERGHGNRGRRDQEKRGHRSRKSKALGNA